MKKRILSVMLVLCMVIGMMPAAFADNVGDDSVDSVSAAVIGEAGDDGVDSSNVAAIGDSKYATLAEAIANAAEDDTVTLLADTTEDVTIPEGKNITLDLGGNKLTNVTSNTIVNKGTLTITDSSESKSGTVDNITDGKASIYNIGSATLNAGTFTRSAEAGKDVNNSGGNSFYTILNHGTMEINSGVTVHNDGNFSSMLDNGYYDYNSRDGIDQPTLTINGGTFTGGINTIKNDDGAVLYIKDGTFSNYTQAALQNHNIATVTGGTFTAESQYAIDNCGCAENTDIGKLTIEGGKFVGGLNSRGELDEITITGGTFTTDPSDYVAPGYKAVLGEDDLYTVAEMDAVAAIGGTKYTSLAAAIAAAQDGNTVTLVADTTEDISISGTKNLTLDLGGKTLTNTGSGKATLFVGGGASVSVKNGSIIGGASYYNIMCGTEEDPTGSIEFTNVTATAGNIGASMADNWGTMTFQSGTYTGGINTVKSEPTGTLYINGGSFECSYAKAYGFTGVILSYGTATVTGGTFTQNATTYRAYPAVFVTAKDKDDDLPPHTIITGGTFINNHSNKKTTYAMGKASNSDFEITGGFYSTAPASSAIANGYGVTAKDSNGYYSIAPAKQITVEPADNGNISSAPSCAVPGSQVSLKISPTTGYTLDTITITKDSSGEEVYVHGNSTKQYFTMPDDDVTIRLTFKVADYKITVKATNGTVTAPETAQYGDKVALSVNADPGYELSSIKVKQASKNVTLNKDNTFTMPAGAVTITATFKAIPYTITVADAEHGQVTVNAETSTVGTAVPVTVSPNEGYELDELYYTEENSDEHHAIEAVDGAYSLTMPAAPVTLHATFKEAEYTVSIASGIENGSLKTDPEKAHIGDTVTVTATPDEGYELDQLTYTAGGSEEAAEITKNDDGVYVFTMPAGNVTVNATFKKSVYTISLDPSMENGTIITSQQTASMGDVITVSPEPATGYSINRLYYIEEGNPSPGFIPVTENDTLAFKMPASNVTIHATFSKSGYAAAIAKTKNGTVSITRNGIPVVNGVSYEDVIAITATPDEGYELDTITVIADDDQPVEVKDGKFTMPNTSVVITVTFKKKTVAPTPTPTATPEPTTTPEPSISTVVSVATDVSEDLSSADKTAIEDVLDNASVTGIEKAVSTDDILEAAGVVETDTKGKQVKIEITTKVVAKGADLSAGTLTFSAAPVATITVDGKEVSKDVPVTNDMLSGKEITIKLPLPKNFTPAEIIHISNDGLRQRYSKQDFKIEDAADGGKVAVLKITHFSQFILNAETHVHVWDEGTVTTEPTATVDGTMHYVCTVCGDEKDEVIPAVPATELTLDPTSIRLSAGQTKALTLTTKPENATGTAVWSSSNPAVATVDEKGNVTAVATGTATITAALGTQAAVCTVSVVCGTDTCQYYTDVDAGAWYHPAVDFVTEHKLMQGVDAKTFVPTHELTRAQLAQVLYNMENPKGTASKKSFKDVKAGAWYYDAVIWAADNGIVKGFEDGRFYPNRPVTREQMVTMLYRYMQFKGLKVDEANDDWKSFSDYSAVHSWAQEAMAWAVSNGVVNGIQNNKLAPTHTAQRSQVAKIIMEITFRYELA